MLFKFYIVLICSPYFIDTEMAIPIQLPGSEETTVGSEPSSSPTGALGCFIPLAIVLTTVSIWETAIEKCVLNLSVCLAVIFTILNGYHVIQ